MKNMMKTTMAVSAALILATSCAAASGGSTPVFMSIASPDHPQTWVAGADQQSAKLRWDTTQQMLVADVQYSNQDYVDSAHPPKVDYHTVAFPNVRLAKNGVDLLATNHDGETATIGHIKSGLLGQEVVLDKHVDLNVHRLDGKIHATLVYNSLITRE